MNNTQLFISEHLKLTPIDVEKDAPVEAGLTLDLDYVRHLQPDMRRPLSVFEVKAYYTELLKELKKGQNQYHFVIRRRDDPEERVAGFIRIRWIEWANAHAFLQIAIGDPEVRAQYAMEVIELALQYAFGELNLYALTCTIPGHEEQSWRLLEQAGFVREATQREAVYGKGQYWALYTYGILKPEWEANRKEVQA
ncbi:MAG TPA: GNAT family protein [Anaerolineaceae bacterium]|mgnify:FL=1|nr:GNAT family protein [Anaerolineaceae bacterium]